MSGGSVVSRSSRGSKSLRDDRSNNDTLSVASSDDCLYDDTVIKSDKFHKQKRRGSGLGNLANYFKSNIKKVMSKEGVPSQVSTQEPTESSEKSHDDHKEKSQCTKERSPQEFLDVMWRSRGYSRELYPTLETAYYNDPTPLQVASYHSRLLELVRNDEMTEIRSLLRSGLSQNPANQKGESMVHEISRLGNHDLLSVVMAEFGADVRISGADGRTPLHEACAGGADKPHFGVVDILTAKDSRMFSLKDVNGKTPLDCIPMQQWHAWIDFLYVRRDMYWPRRLVRVDGQEEPPPLSVELPNSRPLPDPESALTIDLAGLLVSGDITPEGVAEQKKEEDAEVVSTDDSSA
eukprot:CAMPEP_0198137738 /NCGR_PEP_ID=MMETSP1443-20131203/1202_1 /TAXON_ID=186043 /ORGANISM="Entomoneis sp., Strain CCMP2396" /LENGTH=348 /DNA_ID=CAMNT_0043799265 /DNA_START=46 /DNA_END=1092 /DNA_ORIENTATION=-